MTAWRTQRPDPEPARETDRRTEFRAHRPLGVETLAHGASVAHIGRSITIQGDLTGDEDLVLDGQVEGSVSLAGHHLTIGPNGFVRANLTANDVTVHGRVLGNVTATARVEVGAAGRIDGDLVAARIVVHDGGQLNGHLSTKNPPASQGIRRDPAAASRAPA